jgi:hypothetical protein
MGGKPSSQEFAASESTSDLAAVAAATAVTAAARTFGMAVGAGVATEILAVFFDRLTGIDDA